MSKARIAAFALLVVLTVMGSAGSAQSADESSALAGFAGVNLLVNSSFERGLERWNISFPGEGKAVDIAAEQAVDGSYALRLSKAVEGSSIGVAQSVYPIPGQTYRVRGAVRSENLELAPQPRPNGILVRLQYYDVNNQNLQRHTQLFLEDTRGEWVRFDKLVTIPEDAARVLFELMLFRANGSVWWDDVSMILEPVPSDEDAVSLVSEGVPTVDDAVASMLDTIPRVTPQVMPGEHPRLYVTRAEIEGLRQFVRQNPAFATVIDQSIIRPARLVAWDYEDRDIDLPPKPPADQGEEVRRMADPVHQRHARAASTAALGFAYTGDPDMGNTAKRILLTYADRYMDFAQRSVSEGRLTSETREEALWLIEMSWAYDLLLGGDFLTETEQRKIEDMIREAVKVIDRNRLTRTALPWQAGHIAAVAAAGVVLEDEDIIASALVGPKSFADLVGPSFYLDGLAQSTSISHHRFIVERWFLVAEAVYRSGYDLYHYSFNGLTLKDVVDVDFHYVFSHGEHPVVGHSSYGLRLSFHWTLALAYERYKDPRYILLWQTDGIRNLLNTAENRRIMFYLPTLMSAPRVGDLLQAMSFGSIARGGRHISGSTLLVDSGFTFLRGKASDGTQLEALMLFKPHGTINSHQSYDNLTLQLSGKDSVWIPGTGGPGYGYDRPEQQGWYEQTVARSGVVVDETSQYPYSAIGSRYSTDTGGRTSAGTLLSFLALPSVAVADAVTANVYDGVIMNRTLLLSAPYLLDRYTVTSDAEHLYDWVVHVRGQEGEADVELTPRPGPLANKPGYQYMNDVRAGNSDATWSAVWSKPTENMRLIMLGENGTDIVRAVGIGRSVNDPQPLVMARRRADSTQFVALYELYKDSSVVVDLERTRADVYEGVKVVRSDGSHDLWLWRQEAAEFVDRIEVDDSTAFAGREAYFRAPDALKVRSAMMLDGTLLEHDGLILRLDQRADAAVEAAGSEIVAVTQTSAPVLRVSLTVPAPDDNTYRLFKLDANPDGTVVAVEMAELVQEASGGVVTLRFDAGQYEVYLLCTEEPQAGWLDRYAVRYSI